MSIGLTSIRAGDVRHGQWKVFSAIPGELVDNFLQHPTTPLGFSLDYDPAGEWMLERSCQREGLGPRKALRLEQQNCAPLDDARPGIPRIAANGVGAAALASVYAKRVLLAADPEQRCLTVVIVDTTVAVELSTLVFVVGWTGSPSRSWRFDADRTADLFAPSGTTRSRPRRRPSCGTRAACSTPPRVRVPCAMTTTTTAPPA